MKPFSYLLLLMFFAVNSSSGQTFRQYFDGADTIATYTLLLDFDTSSSNVWQVGRPQKVKFNSAATAPNALVTDTIHTYPVNDTSSFSFTMKPQWGYGIMALRWKQKLDLDKKHDGAIIEFSTNGGSTWQNVFNNPLVYNFYGFDTSNRDTLVTGQYAFSGTDTLWKDIWLCFDYSFFSTYDSAVFRYTLLSDSVDSARDGWMIDNMTASVTIMHTVVKTEPDKQYMKVYPTVTSGKLNIEGEHLNRYHIIENMELIDATGRVVEEYGKSPTKYYIDISNHPNGLYTLKIRTNLKTTTSRIILNK